MELSSFVSLIKAVASEITCCTRSLVEDLDFSVSVGCLDYLTVSTFEIDTSVPVIEERLSKSESLIYDLFERQSTPLFEPMLPWPRSKEASLLSLEYSK